MLNSNQQLDFHTGYMAALDEVRRKLLDGDPRDAYDFTLTWIEHELAEGS